MKKIYIWTTLVLLLSLLSPLISRAETPRDCIVSIARAIDESDLDLFTAKVDVDNLINNTIEVFLAEVNKPEIKNQLPPMLALMFSQAASKEGVGSTIRGLLFNESRAFLLNGIASGAFAGKKIKTEVQQGLLTPLFANASLGRKEILQIGEPQSCPDGWIVPFTLLDYGNGLDYAIDGLVQKGDDNLRLTRIVNLRELILQIEEEAKQYNN